MSFEDGIKMWRRHRTIYDEHFSEEEMKILYEIVRGIRYRQTQRKTY